MSLDFYAAIQQIALQFDTCANKQRATATTLAIIYRAELTGPMSFFRRNATVEECNRFLVLVLAELRESIVTIVGGLSEIDWEGLTTEQRALVLKTWEAQKKSPVFAALDAVREDNWCKLRQAAAH